TRLHNKGELKYRIVSMLLSALGCVPGLIAQSEAVSINAALHTSDKPYIQVKGETAIRAKADEAVIDIGVVTEAATPASAAATNATASTVLMAHLRPALVGSDQITNTAYSIQPIYRNPKPGAAPTVTGYSAANVVTVVLHELTRTGYVIDAAVQGGANQIGGLQFRLKDEQSVHDRALREAAARARSSAEAMAAGLGLRVVRVLSAEEGATGSGGFEMHKAAALPPPAGAAPPTPIADATIEVDATVSLRVEIGQ
ncbi:MAG TPA: SIMPL domain-containing protein, partial [Bryobacteraceae bacterium]|nr:SIMPL domain-containing protein [Bryobacteraceae bacterium]